MGAPIVTPDGLTSKQEAFALAVAQGCTYSEAYRQSYDVSGSAPESVHVAACKLAADAKVRLRIHHLLSIAQSAAVAEIAWDKGVLVREAASNLHLSRALAQMGSANGALEIIGRATGLLNDKAVSGATQVRVTTIIINDPRQAQKIIESSAKVLPQEATPESHDAP